MGSEERAPGLAPRKPDEGQLHPRVPAQISLGLLFSLIQFRRHGHAGPRLMQPGLGE